MEIEKKWFRGQKRYFPLKNNQIWSPVCERVDICYPSWLVQWGFVSQTDKTHKKHKGKIRARTSQKRAEICLKYLFFFLILVSKNCILAVEQSWK